MNGLYALKPWFAARLARVRRFLVDRGVRPDVLTWSGVAFGGAAGCAIAFLPAGPIAGVAVAVLLIARLACANLDGGVARESGRTTPFGTVLNELGDRLAEFAVLAGCLAVAPPQFVVGAALAATLPSWVSLAGAAAGAPRVQGGPVGKTERCAQMVLLAVTGAAVPVLLLLVAGSLVTAVLRLRRVARLLPEPGAAPADPVLTETPKGSAAPTDPPLEDGQRRVRRSGAGSSVAGHATEPVVGALAVPTSGEVRS